MHASALFPDRMPDRVAESVTAASAVAALYTRECDRDGAAVSLPRAEVHLIVRFGAVSPGGVDVHAVGGRQTVHRKALRRGQRIVAARLRLDASNAVLGVPASVLAGRIVSLDDLWGPSATQRLCDRLAGAGEPAAAAVVLERAITERLTRAPGRPPHAALALAAAGRLRDANVSAVAIDLGVSERNLRRVFRETLGLSPKTFARLARFDRALRAARADAHPSWASIAVDAGYYDQAHLIAEFRTIAGVTPRALLGELRDAPLVA